MDSLEQIEIIKTKQEHTNHMNGVELHDDDWLPNELKLTLMVDKDKIYLEAFGVVPMTPAEYGVVDADHVDMRLTQLIKAIIYDYNNKYQQGSAKLYYTPCDYFTVGVDVTAATNTEDLKEEVTWLFYDNCKSFIGRAP